MSPGTATGSIDTVLQDFGPAVLLQWGNDYRFCRGIWLASMTIALYDCLLSLEEEIMFLRRGAFNWNKFLYLTNRYWPMVNLIFDNVVLTLYEPSDRLCLAWINFLCYSGMLMHLSIGLILILRIYAMHSRNRTLLIALLILFLAQLIVEMAILVPNALKSTVFMLPPIFTGCIPDNPAPYLWTYWLPMTVLETILCALAVGKSIQMGRDSRRRPAILTLLLRDSIIYFGGALTVIITNLLLWSTARPSLFDAFVGAAFAMHSILGCHLLLNLQKMAPPNEEYSDTKFEAVTLTTFAPSPSDFTYTNNIEL